MLVSDSSTLEKTIYLNRGKVATRYIVLIISEGNNTKSITSLSKGKKTIEDIVLYNSRDSIILVNRK